VNRPSISIGGRTFRLSTSHSVSGLTCFFRSSNIPLDPAQPLGGRFHLPHLGLVLASQIAAIRIARGNSEFLEKPVFVLWGDHAHPDFHFIAVAAVNRRHRPADMIVSVLIGIFLPRPFGEELGKPRKTLFRSQQGQLRRWISHIAFLQEKASLPQNNVTLGSSASRRRPTEVGATFNK